MRRFERRYPYAPLEDKPYVVTKHIHEQQKVRATILIFLGDSRLLGSYTTFNDNQDFF